MKRRKLRELLGEPARILYWLDDCPVIEVQAAYLAPKYTRWSPLVWLLKFRCPVCGEVHTHGGGGDEDPMDIEEPSARAPHCRFGGVPAYYLFLPKNAIVRS
jgi:hypothetical protein